LEPAPLMGPSGPNHTASVPLTSAVMVATAPGQRIPSTGSTWSTGPVGMLTSMWSLAVNVQPLRSVVSAETPYMPGPHTAMDQGSSSSNAGPAQSTALQVQEAVSTMVSPSHTTLGPVRSTVIGTTGYRSM